MSSAGDPLQWATAMSCVNMLEIGMTAWVFRYWITFPLPDISFEQGLRMAGIFAFAIPSLTAIPGGWIMDPGMPDHSPPVYEDGEAAYAYNQEELKIIAETRKILGLPNLAIACTTVRVPVETGHSESVWIETESSLSPADIRAQLAAAPGVVVQDDPAAQVYPLARSAAGTDLVYVGRIRRDLSHERGIALWLAADNLRKGAATNAVQVAELLFS